MAMQQYIESASWAYEDQVQNKSRAVGMQNSTQTLEQLEHAFDNIKRKLFSELHEVVRQQVFPAHDATLPVPQIDIDVQDDSDNGAGNDSNHSSDMVASQVRSRSAQS